jgi:hypothetical protein
MQSGANSSLPKIPVNREKYREFWPLGGPDHAYPSTNKQVNRFQAEIVTGNEQGKYVQEQGAFLRPTPMR